MEARTWEVEGTSHGARLLRVLDGPELEPGESVPVAAVEDMLALLRAEGENPRSRENGSVHFNEAADFLERRFLGG